jgi:hypothetical protein
VRRHARQRLPCRAHLRRRWLGAQRGALRHRSGGRPGRASQCPPRSVDLRAKGRAQPERQLQAAVAAAGRRLCGVTRRRRRRRRRRLQRPHGRLQPLRRLLRGVRHPLALLLLGLLVLLPWRARLLRWQRLLSAGHRLPGARRLPLLLPLLLPRRLRRALLRRRRRVGLPPKVRQGLVQGQGAHGTGGGAAQHSRRLP